MWPKLPAIGVRSFCYRLAQHQFAWLLNNIALSSPLCKCIWWRWWWQRRRRRRWWYIPSANKQASIVKKLQDTSHHSTLYRPSSIAPHGQYTKGEKWLECMVTSCALTDDKLVTALLLIRPLHWGHGIHSVDHFSSTPFARQILACLQQELAKMQLQAEVILDGETSHGLR